MLIRASTDWTKHPGVLKRFVDYLSQGHVERTVLDESVEQQKKLRWISVTDKPPLQNVCVSTDVGLHAEACIVLCSSEGMVMRRNASGDRLQITRP